MTENLKVICKRGELYFPELPASAGKIAGWAPIGQHFEAGAAYYQSRTNASEEEAAELMRRYKAEYCAPCGTFNMIRVYRQTVAMRRKAWECKHVTH